MKKVKLFEEFHTESLLNEGKGWAKLMKAVRAGSKSGPWTIVSFEGRPSKIVNQEHIQYMDLIPAHYEEVKKRFPNAKMSIEDNTGMSVYNESVVTEEYDVSGISRKDLKDILNYLDIKDISYDFDGKAEILDFDMTELDKKGQAELKKLGINESVVTEGETSAVYTDPNTGKKYDLQYVSTKKRWELDIMKKGASIYSSAITTIKRDTLAEIQEWLDGYKIDSSWTKGLSESVVTEGFKHIIYVETPTEIVSKPIAAQILALAKKGVRSKEIGLEMGFIGNAKLAADTFQKVKNRIYFELDENESVVTEGFEKAAIQQALKDCGYDLKQSEFKLGKKKQSGAVFYYLNGEIIGNDDYGYEKLVQKATERIKENPKKYGLNESVVTEGKDDFMARYGSANINLKKGYKHHTEEELNDLYDKLGDLVKTLRVKDVTLVFESEVSEGAINSDYKYIYKKIIQKYPDVIGNFDLIKSFVDDEIDNIKITDAKDILNKFEEYRKRKFKGVVSKLIGRAVKESVVTEAGGFAGWIAIFNGKKLEIDKSEADGIYNAKLLAIKKLNVPKSKLGLLSISPAVDESVVTEGQVEPQIMKIAELTGENPKKVEEYVSARALNITSLLQHIRDDKQVIIREFRKAIKGDKDADNMFIFLHKA